MILFYTFLVKTGLKVLLFMIAFVTTKRCKKEGSNFKSLLTNLSTIAIINFQLSQVLN